MSNEKLIYKRRDIRKYFGITDYCIDQFIADGILPEPIRKKGRHPFWQIRQVRLAERRIHDLENPRPTRSLDPDVRGHSAKQFEQMRRNLYGE